MVAAAAARWFFCALALVIVSSAVAIAESAAGKTLLFVEFLVIAFKRVLLLCQVVLVIAVKYRATLVKRFRPS